MNIDEAMTIDEIKLFIEAVAARLGVTFQIEIDDRHRRVIGRLVSKA